MKLLPYSSWLPIWTHCIWGHSFSSIVENLFLFILKISPLIILLLFFYVFLCISMSLSLPAAFWESSSIWSYNWLLCSISDRGSLLSFHSYYLVHIFSLHSFLFLIMSSFALDCSYVPSFSFWCFFYIFGLSLSAILLQMLYTVPFNMLLSFWRSCTSQLHGYFGLFLFLTALWKG